MAKRSAGFQLGKLCSHRACACTQVYMYDDSETAMLDRGLTLVIAKRATPEADALQQLGTSHLSDCGTHDRSVHPPIVCWACLTHHTALSRFCSLRRHATKLSDLSVCCVQVAECFPWSASSRFEYSRTNHNSVLGIRAVALEAGATVQAVELEPACPAGSVNAFEGRCCLDCELDWSP